MTGPSGNSEFCFLETLNVPRGEAEEITEVKGILTVSKGPVIRCFVMPSDSKIEKIKTSAKTNLSYPKITTTLFFFSANKKYR